LFHRHRHRQSSAPSRHHAGAAYHCQSDIHTVASVTPADADQIVDAAESSVAANEGAQSVVPHHLITVKVGPVMPLSPISVATQPHVQVVGDTNEAIFNRIQMELLREYLGTETDQRIVDLRAAAAEAG